MNAAMHVDAVAMSAEKGTEQVADTATVTDTDSIADTDAAEDGEARRLPSGSSESPPFEPDKNVDKKESEINVLATRSRERRCPRRR